MRIYQITDVGEAEASAPVSNPTPARRVLYYLRKRSNRAASDDMIVSELSRYDIDRSETRSALGKLVKARAIRALG